MNGDQKDQSGNDKRTRQRFPRVKGHCGPGRGRAAGVMNGVRGLEPPRPVHQAVGPIKPRVMPDQKKQNRKRSIPKRPIGAVRVNLGPALVLPPPSDDACRYPVNRRTGEGPANLSPDLGLKPGIEPCVFARCDPRESSAGQQIADADDQRHRKRRKDDWKEKVHQRKPTSAPQAAAGRSVHSAISSPSGDAVQSRGQFGQSLPPIALGGRHRPFSH
jgi:hypothetical protein